jgi:NAD(P)-dependent dehydrogenase (short-subunit alcohol dehydrogenase family)
MTWALAGKSVLVTGAARGIGAESARRLAGRGARLSLVGLEAERLEEVAASCGSGAAWFEADVTDRAELQRAVDGAVEAHGGIDVAIANAGIASVGMVRSIDEAAFERTIEVNLVGAWRTIRACLPHVIERRGYVLAVASMAAAVHGPGMAAYSASKAGIEAFSDSLRGEVSHLGVDVGVAYFSWIATDMVAGADADPVGGLLRGRLRGPLGKTHPLSAVGDAVVEGVEKRARRVVVPRWARLLLAARGVIGPLAARRMRDAVAEADEAMQLEIDRRGKRASEPVGAGGAADARAAFERATAP